MRATNKYKVERLGSYWHVMRLHYTGWWIFENKMWLSEFPYYWQEQDAYDELARKIKNND